MHSCTLAVAGALGLSLAAGIPTPDHIVVGQSPPGGTPLKLFTSGTLLGASGHGPSIAPGAVIGFKRINLASTYAQPRFGGYSFSTAGDLDVGMDYAATGSGHELNINLLPGPPANFAVRMQRIAYSRPADAAVYTEFGSPRMVEDGNEYAFGDAFNGGHVHPLFLFRRPGLTRIDLRFTSDQWLPSDDYSYWVTTVPGRGTLAPINMSSAFNADIVDSDLADNPLAFDGAAGRFVLDGLYGTSAGLPASGALAGFQLGGPGGANLAGSANNVLLDDGVRSSAATVDLVAAGQSGNYLGVEILLAGSGSFTSSDVLNVTLRYTDNTTRVVAIRLATSAEYLPYRPIGDWQMPASPRPWTAVGRTGDRSAGFARSNGAAIDAGAGENTFFLRACSPVDLTRTLKEIQFADYTGAGRIGVFAILCIGKAPLAIVTSTLPQASEGQLYSAPIFAEGTPPFRNWMATGLPAGLSIDMNTGLISGTPASGTAAGSPYSVTVSVEDSIQFYDAFFAPESANRMLTLTFPTVVAGDIDGDGDVDSADVNHFVRVLLGLETDPQFVMRSDVNNSGIANGADVAPFVALLPGL